MVVSGSVIGCNVSLAGAWLLASLTIPLLLPLGYQTHGSYYLWALLSPLAIVVGLFTERLGRLAETRSAGTWSLGKVDTTVIVVSAMAYGVTSEVGGVFGGIDGPPYQTDEMQEAVDAGHTARAMGVTELSDVVLTCNWGPTDAKCSTGAGAWPASSFAAACAFTGPLAREQSRRGRRSAHYLVAGPVRTGHSSGPTDTVTAPQH